MEQPGRSKRILLVGFTGSGKSSVGNWLTNTTAFVEGEGIDAITKETTLHTGDFAEGFSVSAIDTPGYLDTEGKDTVHITKMVEKVKNLKEIDLVALVLNYWNPRFDSNVKQMLRIFFTMFKHSNMWDNFAIIFTRAYAEEVTSVQKDSKRQEYCGEVRKFVESLGAKMVCNPFCCFVDTHPEGPRDLATQNERALLAGFLASLSPMSTSELQDPGEFMKVEEETRMVVTEKNSTPIFEQFPIIEKIPEMGRKSGFKFGIGSFSIEFGGGTKVLGYKTVQCGTANRHVGEKVLEKGVIMRREKRTWYDGKTVSYSPWAIIDNFVTEKNDEKTVTDNKK